MQESWEEWRRKGKLANSTMEEREAYFVSIPRRKKGYLYPHPHEIWPFQDFRPDYPAPGAKIRPKIRPPYWVTRPKVLSRNLRAGLFK
jgi:hypothetical protein